MEVDTVPERTLTVYATHLQFIRTVTDIRGEWLLEYAPSYFDASNWNENEKKSPIYQALERLRMAKKDKKRIRGEGVDGDRSKKRKDRR